MRPDHFAILQRKGTYFESVLSPPYYTRAWSCCWNLGTQLWRGTFVLFCCPSHSIPLSLLFLCWKVGGSVTYKKYLARPFQDGTGQFAGWELNAFFTTVLENKAHFKSVSEMNFNSRCFSFKGILFWCSPWSIPAAWLLSLGRTEICHQNPKLFCHRHVVAISQ